MGGGTSRIRGIHACIEHAIWDTDVVGADSSIFPLGRGAETGSKSRNEEKHKTEGLYATTGSLGL